MATSILFSQDLIMPYTDSAPAPKQPPQLHLTPSKITTVDHWLSQQYAQRSTTHQTSTCEMPNTNNIFTQASHGAEDIMGDYTFTTEHHVHHDEYTQWAPSSLPSYPALHLQTQQDHQQSRSPGYSDAWNDFASFSSPSDHTSSPSYLLTPNYSPDSNLSQFSISRQPLPHTSPIGSSELSLSPLYPISPRLPSPSTPGSATQSFMPSPTLSDMNNMLLLEQSTSSSRRLATPIANS
ncbi:hypothetical protein BDN70DRAFT_608852 [Pholiota conissans]|uniref:Uncharacterized protein n=1 Tax=Pholiota conissans TaxID=109636 RepID=A0A9P5Z6W2_9AGAR|nr:hypothetical protein BDN70DRAFT_608852 [Pholiota conissans]